MRRGKGSLVVLVAVVVAAVFTSTATADKPVKSQFSFTATSVLTGACAFDIGVSSIESGTEIDFYSQSGALVRSDFTVNEQDTFSANGETLTGVPFSFAAQALYDSSGNLTHFYAEGVVEKVPLPDGSLFISAGRSDFVADGFPEFLLTPDVGGTVNLAGFCAALS